MPNWLPMSPGLNREMPILISVALKPGPLLPAARLPLPVDPPAEPPVAPASPPPDVPGAPPVAGVDDAAVSALAGSLPAFTAATIWAFDSALPSAPVGTGTGRAALGVEVECSAAGSPASGSSFVDEQAES